MDKVSLVKNLFVITADEYNNLNTFIFLISLMLVETWSWFKNE